MTNRKWAAVLLAAFCLTLVGGPAWAAQLTVKDIPGAYDDQMDTPGFESASAGGDSFTVTGEEYILLKNDDSVDTQVTINSVADDLGRKNDLTDTVPASGGITIVGPMKREGWEQGDGTIKITYPDGPGQISVAILRRK